MVSLIPKEKIFFDLLESAAQNTLHTSRLLRDLFEDYQDFEKRKNAIYQAEHIGDDITAQIIKKLHQTFITPIDRQYIKGLASALDDIVDSLDHVTDRLHIYKIEEPTSDSISQVRIIVRCCEEIEKGVFLLKNEKNLKNIVNHCIELHRLENEGDSIYIRALEKLFDSNNDVLYIIKWRDIYSILESTINLAQDISDHLEGIVLEHV